MRRALLATGFALLAGPAPPAAATSTTGPLAARTQIASGCPGPIREAEPGWDPWRPFANARVTVGTRALRSAAGGRFSVRLRPGRYVVRGLPQPNARGTSVVVSVRAGATTRVVLRFEGFPKMVCEAA